MTVYVLDASVAVAALRATEPAHEAALARMKAVAMGHDQIVVPAIFDGEVMSALVRRGVRHGVVRGFLDRELAERKRVTIGPSAADAISAVVAQTGLRAADAAYVWVALRYQLPLITFDREMGGKAPVTVQAP